MDSGNAEAWTALGAAHANLGSLSKAISCFQKALGEQPLHDLLQLSNAICDAWSFPALWTGCRPAAAQCLAIESCHCVLTEKASTKGHGSS